MMFVLIDGEITAEFRKQSVAEPRRTPLACAVLTKRVLLTTALALGVAPASASAALPAFRAA
jgi:hypothetical protein